MCHSVYYTNNKLLLRVNKRILLIETRHNGISDLMSVYEACDLHNEIEQVEDTQLDWEARPDKCLSMVIASQILWLLLHDITAAGIIQTLNSQSSQVCIDTHTIHLSIYLLRKRRSKSYHVSNHQVEIDYSD